MVGEAVYMVREAVCMVGGSCLQARKFYLGIWVWHRWGISLGTVSVFSPSGTVMVCRLACKSEF